MDSIIKPIGLKIDQKAKPLKIVGMRLSEEERTPSLPAATAPAGPATAQAVASAPVIPSAPASPVAAAPFPQAHPSQPTFQAPAPQAAPIEQPAPPAAAPAAPRFGQPGYNPLLHGGGGKPPLDLRIKRALGIKDYRDAGPPTMSEVRARQVAPAAQAQAPVNPVLKPGAVTPIDDRTLLQRMLRPPTDNEIMYGSRDEQHARIRKELGLPPLTQESETRVSAVIDAVPGEEKDEASFGDAVVRGAYSAARSMIIAPSKVAETLSAAGRGVLEFLLTPSAATGDFEAMMDAAAKASGVDPESTFSRQLKNELGKQTWVEERYQQKLEKLLVDEFERNGVAGKNGVLIAHGIVGLATRLAMIKATTGLLPGQTGGASGSTWVESWANSAVKTASHASRTALFTYATQPGSHEERKERAITTYFYMMTPTWSVGIPSNFIAPIADIASNFWISNQLGMYDGAIEQAKAEHGDEWKSNLWRHLTPEMVLDGATNIAFGMLTRSATAQFLNDKVGPYINEVARELKKHGSTEPLIIDLQTKMDAALKQAETARASGDRNAVDVALETYQFLRSAHESLVSDATRQAAPVSSPEARMDYSGIRPEQEELDATRAAATEALGTPRIGAEAQMEAERGAVPVSGDAWRQMAGIEAPSSAARVNPLLEPERVAEPAAEAVRPAEPQAASARTAEKVAAPEAVREVEGDVRVGRGGREAGRGSYWTTSKSQADKYARGEGALGLGTEQGRRGIPQTIVRDVSTNARIFEIDDTPNPFLRDRLMQEARFAKEWQADWTQAQPTNKNLWDAAQAARVDIQRILTDDGYQGAAHRNYVTEDKPQGSRDVSVWDESALVPHGQGAFTIFRGQRTQAKSPLTLEAEAVRPAEQVAAPEAARAAEPQSASRAAPEPTLASRYTPEQLSEMKAHQEKMLDTMKGEPREAKAQDAAKPPELMTPEELNATSGFKYDPNLTSEGEYKNGVVVLGPKAMQMTPEGRADVIRHELSHELDTHMNKDDYLRLLDAADRGDLGARVETKTGVILKSNFTGQYKPSEILVDAYAHLMGPKGGRDHVMTRAPKVAKLAMDIASEKQLPIPVAEWDKLNNSTPPGYTREGDLYVFKGDAQGEKPAPPYAPKPVNVGDVIEAKSSMSDGLVHRGRVTSIDGDKVSMVNQDNAPVLVSLKNVIFQGGRSESQATVSPSAAPRTAADLAKPAQEPARVAEPAQEPAPPKPTTPLAKLVADTPQAFRVTSSRGNVHNVKMPDGVTYPIRAESKAEAIVKAQELASKTKPLSEMNDADLKARADELGVSYDPKSTAKELRDRIRAAQRGGFIDISPRRPSKTDHPFVRQMKENDIRVHEWQKKHTRDAISALRSEVVDRQADVKQALKGIGANDAIKRLVLRQGSGAEAARQFRVAEKSITDVLPTKDRELFKYYLQAMRVVEATKVQADKGIELKSPMSAEDAKLFLNEEFVKLPQEQQDAVMGAAKKYWGVMREQLDALYAEGLIGKEGYEAIVTKHQFYSPRRFVEFIDPQTIKPKGEMRHDSGVDALDKGSESAMAADPMYLMAHVITRTQNRLFRNRANKALYDTAISSPENSVVRVLGKNETPTRTEDSVSVFIAGQEVRMAMPKQLAAEWDGLPPALSRNMAAILQWASGTKVLKTLATGANPEFAISNLPRDAMYAWFTSGQYSSVLPKAIGQILLDYKRSMRDAIKRTGAYTDYVKEGGGMDFLTTQGMTRKPSIEGGHRLARKIGDILAWAGETSEIATRLAVRNRAIRNGLSPEDATYIARNMLDFSQGGTFAKAADNVIPYLNAAIQGTRGGFRAFKENPKVASFKAAQLVAIGYALAQVAATFTPELWDSINAREKASKWIIPLPWTRKDKEGNSRHAYIAIPKDQFQQVFAAIGQSFVDGVRGNPWEKQILDSLSSTVPVETSGIVFPIMNAALAYFGNYDTWTSENVWQGYEDISPSKEQSWQTPEIAVDIAELASRMGVEISPERLATATSKVVPTSNPLGSIMSSIYATGNPDPELGRTIVEKLRDIPGIRRVLRFSRPSNLQKFTMDKAYQYNVDVAGMTDLQAREAIKVAERKRADVRYPLNIEADKIARQAVRGDVSSDDLQKWIDSVPQEERKRVESRIKAQYKKSWKSPAEIIRVITDPGTTSDLSKQANAEWLAKYGMDGMTAKDLRTAFAKEAREQGWNTEMYDSKGKLTAYGRRKLQLSRFIRKHNIE